MAGEKEIKLLPSGRQTISVTGSLSYREACQAWNLIQLKKEIIQEFPQLREKRSKFGYKMVLHKDFKELRRCIKEVEERGDSVPLLLFLGREK